jgi:hypothetical protein
LLSTLFAGDIEGGQISEAQRQLKQQGGFADTGLTAQQTKPSGDHAAPQDPVQFPVGDRNAPLFFQNDLVDGLNLALSVD